jgi:hypothetical protein
MTHVVTHEFGHQWAGLSHNYFDLVQYHQGKVPVSAHDVMDQEIDIHYASGRDIPVFDSYDSLRTNGDTTSCQSNLFNSRLFTR